jgi:hypothetical protein
MHVACGPLELCPSSSRFEVGIGNTFVAVATTLGHEASSEFALALLMSRSSNGFEGVFIRVEGCVAWVHAVAVRVRVSVADTLTADREKDTALEQVRVNWRRRGIVWASSIVTREPKKFEEKDVNGHASKE